MSAYAIQNNKSNIKQQKSHIDSKTTESSDKSEGLTENMAGIQMKQVGSCLKVYPQIHKVQSDRTSESLMDEEETNNFYQTYINLFVNFFNQQADTVNLNTIKSIIRPNNRFVIIDLLKALFEFCRNEIKMLIKNTTFLCVKEQKVIMPRNNTIDRLRTKNLECQFDLEADVVVDFQTGTKYNRRVQTEPEVNSPRNIYQETKQTTGKMSPLKQFRTKNSLISYGKQTQAEQSKSKTDETQQLNIRYLQAHFIDANIKQSLYQKNYQFVCQLNLEKLESRINNIYVELNRLNVGNNDIITRYYEENMQKKNKFNYDPRGLYSEEEIQLKKKNLYTQIAGFLQRHPPTNNSNSLELAQYALEFRKYKNKSQELQMLNKPKNKYPKAVTGWLPLKIQYSQSIVEPLKLQIQEIQPISGQLICYHWKKYRKQFSITQFLKQKVKTEYERIQQKNQKLDKNVEKELFKKKKFRKSLFLDNRKKMNDFIQSNNVVFTKKESIFPMLKGIQQNFIKNSNTMVINNGNYALDNNLSKSKDIRIDFRQENKLKLSQNLTCKASSSNYSQSKGKQRRFESIKRGLDAQQKSERKYSESEKLLEKIPQKDRSDIFSKLAVKYQLPVTIGTRGQRQSQRYEKKNLISMSKILDIRIQNLQSEPVPKSIELSISPDKKLNILNLF